MLSRDVVKEIERVVGPEDLLEESEDRACYSYDANTSGEAPSVVAFPESAEEVSRILRLANEHLFPVFPRGAGTGMTGGAVPTAEGVVLVMTRMQRIKEISPEDSVAIVEPGVINYELQREVERRGLFFPPDPASYMYSTIGGNVAECAGGPRAVKYGVMRDYVLGLEVVLPTGEIIRTGGRTMKGVVGYDLTRLFVGSEGTLGVITEITLKLLPLPEARETLLALFGSMEEAAGAVAEIFSSGVLPSVLEFMDEPSLRCAESFLGAQLPEAKALLLVEVDGLKESLGGAMERVRRACLSSGAKEVRRATREEEVEDIWRVRRCLSQAAYALGPVKVNEDVTVPRSKIPPLVAGVHALARKFRLPVLCFGHAGDGNIHVNFMIERSEEMRKKIERAVEELFSLTLSLGGTLSGEHGVGIAKLPFVKMELGPKALEAMKRIKEALDPNGILNPGKVFLF